MIVNQSNLKTLFVVFKAAFAGGLGQASSQYTDIATVVPSTTGSEEYGWLGNFPSLREWVGERQVKNLTSHGYTLRNKSYEATVSVPRTAIEDDQYGVYTPAVTELGAAAGRHADELVFGLLKAGHVAQGYDGVPFFSASHPVINEKGKAVNQSNTDAGEGSEYWYVLDTSRALKPLIFQNRKSPSFVAKTAEDDDNVFYRNEYVYGVDARRNAGFGFWQLAQASNQLLNEANLIAAIVAMTSRKGDNDVPLGISPNKLVVPSTLEFAARQLVTADFVSDGAGGTKSNPLKGRLEVLVSSWLN